MGIFVKWTQSTQPQFSQLTTSAKKSLFLTIPKMFSVIVCQSPTLRGPVISKTYSHWVLLNLSISWRLQNIGAIIRTTFGKQGINHNWKWSRRIWNKLQITVDAMLLCFNVPRWTWNCQLKVTFWSINENNYLSLVSRMTLPRCLSSGLKRLQDYQ